MIMLLTLYDNPVRPLHMKVFLLFHVVWWCVGSSSLVHCATFFRTCSYVHGLAMFLRPSLCCDILRHPMISLLHVYPICANDS